MPNEFDTCWNFGGWGLFLLGFVTQEDSFLTKIKVVLEGDSSGGG